jgi:hypothetical protein
MTFWHRVLITVLLMIVTSFAIGQAWSGLFGGTIPSYLSGVVGGLTALPIWEFLKEFRKRPDAAPAPVPPKTVEPEI